MIASDPRLSLIHSYSDSILGEFSISKPAETFHLEFICLVSNNCMIDPVSWMYNGELVNTGKNWLRYDSDIPIGEYCCLKDGISSCITISDKGQ